MTPGHNYSVTSKNTAKKSDRHLLPSSNCSYTAPTVHLRTATCKHFALISVDMHNQHHTQMLDAPGSHHANEKVQLNPGRSAASCCCCLQVSSAVGAAGAADVKPGVTLMHSLLKCHYQPHFSQSKHTHIHTHIETLSKQMDRCCPLLTTKSR